MQRGKPVWDSSVRYISPNDPCSCATLSKVEDYVLVLQEFVIGCTLSLRVCAMYGFNRRVFISLSIAAITTVGLGAWAVIGPDTALETSVPGCHNVTPHNQAIRVVLAWEAQLVCDILILGLTLRRAYTYNRDLALRPPSLLRTMFRDGALYFGMICLVNLANIVMIYVCKVHQSFGLFTNVISVRRCQYFYHLQGFVPHAFTG
ncbi:hypothetical protein B0H14DRAFT_2851991, partial [Mycena olivaceomarginata]